MSSRPLRIALLLFGSGMTALIYQVAWMRELRLVFGFSTAASAAVVAIFMGGLGLGGWILGRRADLATRPLAFYGWLEIAVAASAAVTPGLLWLVRAAYIAVGGSVRLGIAGGTVARLLLSAIVLAVPTVLMGGTLPAATRAAESDEDAGRRFLALLYGLNTLGAVAGTLVSTFYLLERLGTRETLWAACAVNAAVGAAAVLLARGMAAVEPSAVEAAPAQVAIGRHGEEPGKKSKAKQRRAERRAAGATGATGVVVREEVFTPAAPERFVLLAAGITGFAFTLMELVW